MTYETWALLLSPDLSYRVQHCAGHLALLDMCGTRLELYPCGVVSGGLLTHLDAVDIGHNFQSNAIGWKWKLSTCLGGDGVSQIRNKTSIGLFPGFDLRIGWRAEYVLPEIHGAVGTGEPVFDMDYGRLQASIDRL